MSRAASSSTVRAGSGAADDPGRRRWGAALAWLAFAAYAILLGRNMVVVAGGSDSSGYLNSARLLAAGRLHAEFRVPPEFGAPGEVVQRHFAPAGFNTFPGRPHLTPVYPTGMPLHFALAGKLFGWTAGPWLVQLAASLAAVWLCWRIARALGLAPALSFAAAVMLAVFPVFLFTSLQTLSDTLATAWTLAAVYAGLRAHRSPGWAVACGAALSIAVLVRPTNLLFAPALIVLIGATARRLIGFVAAGLPAAGWFFFYNDRLYGGPLQSGYGNIYADFAVAFAWPTALHFARWLVAFLPAIMLVLPLAALLRRSTRRRELLALLLGWSAIAGFYLFYGISRETWWCLRFILPGVPLLILMGVLGVEALAQGPGARWPNAFRPAAALALSLWAIGNAWHWLDPLSILHVPTYERAYAESAELARTRIPADSIVVCGHASGALFYYTKLAPLIFDSITPAEFAGYVARARGAGRGIYAVLFDIEEEAVFTRNCPGAWTRVDGVRNIGIWKLP